MKATATSRRCFPAVSALALMLTLYNVTEACAAVNDAAPNFLPADRATIWKPGMMAVGGIPARSTVCATLSPNNPASDDTIRIQAAINVCPVGQVVQLTVGTFLINS